MSLVRLLTNGKSLVGIKTPEHRYRKAQGGWLPKFGGVQKNPFSSVTTSEARPVASASPEEVPAATPPFNKTQPLPRPTLAARSAPKADLAKKLTSGAKSAGQWLAAINPFSVSAAKPKPAHKPAAGARMAAPLQGELSLDKVKVVRNDLCDADLEVVPLRSSAARVAGAGATSTDDSGWGQLSSGTATEEQVRLS
jgi:hypothetical protein